MCNKKHTPTHILVKFKDKDEGKSLKTFRQKNTLPRNKELEYINLPISNNGWSKILNIFKALKKNYFQSRILCLPEYQQEKVQNKVT